MKLWLLGLALLAACEVNESKLDGFGVGTPTTAQFAEWEAQKVVTDRAAPLGLHLDLLRVATRGPRRTPAERAARIEELFAWRTAGGSIPPMGQTMSGMDDTFALYLLIKKAIEEHAGDDRIAELALYASQRMRQDGTSVLPGLHSVVLLKTLIERRPLPPPNAAAYAPTDAEVAHLFASEAEWSAGSVRELEGRPEPPGMEGTLVETKAYLQRFAKAPSDRAGLLAFLNRERVAHAGPVPDMFVPYAVRLYASVDAYQRWLANRQTL